MVHSFGEWVMVDKRGAFSARIMPEQIKGIIISPARKITTLFSQLQHYHVYYLKLDNYPVLIDIR